MYEVKQANYLQHYLKRNKEKKDMEEMNSKLVFSPRITRNLLKMGN